MKRINGIIIIIITLAMAGIIMLRSKPDIAYSSEKTVNTNIIVNTPAENIKSVTLRLYSEVKNDADEKLWGPAINSIEWFTAKFLGEPVEAIRSGLETYVLSEEALDGFIAVAAFKIDQAVKKNLVANNRHTGSAEIEAGQYTAELRRAVDVDAAIKNMYSGLITDVKGLTALEQRYYRFRRQTPGLDPPMELFLLIGSIAEILLKTDGKEIDTLLKAILSVETNYQAAKVEFQNILKTGIISSRTQFNTRLRAILDKISESLTLY